MGFDYERWLVVGNAHNWGRADNFKEALGNAIKEAGSRPMSECHIYRIDANRVLKNEDLWVDDFGTVHYATDVRFTKLPKFPVTEKINKAYTAFSDMVEEIMYADPFDKAFNE